SKQHGWCIHIKQRHGSTISLVLPVSFWAANPRLARAHFRTRPTHQTPNVSWSRSVSCFHHLLLSLCAWRGLASQVRVGTYHQAGRQADRQTINRQKANGGHTWARPVHTCTHNKHVHHHLSLSLACLGLSSPFRGDTINKPARRPTDDSKRGVCSIFRCNLL
ncbi:unnamed protein product, partial [Ectocarpus fasciculatus]